MESFESPINEMQMVYHISYKASTIMKQERIYDARQMWY